VALTLTALLIWLKAESGKVEQRSRLMMFSSSARRAAGAVSVWSPRVGGRGCWSNEARCSGGARTKTTRERAGRADGEKGKGDEEDELVSTREGVQRQYKRSLDV